MNIISSGGGTGLGHTLTSFNYAIQMSEFLIASGVDVSLYFKWRCHSSFLNIYDVNIPYFNSSDPVDLLNTSNCYKYKAKNKTDWNELYKHTNIVVDADSTATLEYDFLFKVVRPKSQVCEQIISIVNNLLDCGHYTAIHVRGSDQIGRKFNLDYEKFLKFHFKRIDDIILNTNNKILLCSDNQDIVMKYVDNKKIFSTSLVYDLYNESVIIKPECALHSGLIYQQPHMDERVDLSATIDLFLLIFSNELYADVANSGYAQLAAKFNKEFLKRKITVTDTLNLIN